MKTVDINTIKNKLGEYTNNKLYLIKEIKNDSEKQKYLKQLYGNNYKYRIGKTSIISEFEELQLDETDEVIVFGFNEFLPDRKIMKEHLILVKNNRLLSEIIEQYELEISDLFVKTTTYLNYDTKTNHLLNRVVLKEIFNKTNKNMVMSLASLLGTDGKEYYKKDYEYMYHDNEPIIIKMDREYYMKGINGFENRLAVSYNMIEKHINFFNGTFEDELFCKDDIQEYKIKRKKRS